MVTADEYKTSAPPDVAWEADESCLRCVVDHRPEEAAGSFVFSRVAGRAAATAC